MNEALLSRYAESLCQFVICSFLSGAASMFKAVRVVKIGECTANHALKKQPLAWYLKDKRRLKACRVFLWLLLCCVSGWMLRRALPRPESGSTSASTTTQQTVYLRALRSPSLVSKNRGGQESSARQCQPSSRPHLSCLISLGPNIQLYPGDIFVFHSMLIKFQNNAHNDNHQNKIDFWHYHWCMFGRKK